MAKGRRISVDVTTEEHTALKIIAARRQTNIAEIIRAAVRKEISDISDKERTDAMIAIGDLGGKLVGGKNGET